MVDLDGRYCRSTSSGKGSSSRMRRRLDGEGPGAGRVPPRTELLYTYAAVYTASTRWPLPFRCGVSLSNLYM